MMFTLLVGRSHECKNTPSINPNAYISALVYRMHVMLKRRGERRAVEDR